MLPRADMNSARPVAAVEPIRATIAVGDAREELYTRLNQMAVGRTLQAQVLSRMNDGAFMVKLLDTPVRMALPGNTQAGDLLDLTFAGSQPRPTFLLRAPVAGSNTSLSNTGRLIDTVLRAAQNEGAPAALVGKTPLLPSASAQPTQIASALQDTLAYSGLFYESHVQQWASGDRPLAELMREPQSKYSNPSLVSAALESEKAEAARSLQTDAAAKGMAALAGEAGAEFLDAALEADGSQTTHSENANAAKALAEHALGAKAGIKEYEAAMEKFAAVARSENTLQQDKALGKNPAELRTTENAMAAQQSLQTDTLNGETTRLISLQLETLEQRRVAWQGELWPGQEMEWEVTEDTSRNATNEVERSWQSVVRFELPTLGAVAAAIRLSGDRLQVQVRAADEATTLLLRSHGNDLISALDAAGSPVDLLTVKRDESV